jgi:hypothetical protein
MFVQFNELRQCPDRREKNEKEHEYKVDFQLTTPVSQVDKSITWYNIVAPNLVQIRT